MVNNQPLVLAKPVPPGWKHRLYGGQDACRYGAVAAPRPERANGF